jgi:L-rhamnose mutarotase
MQRQAVKMFLNAGCAAEYRKRHDAIWAEVVALLADAGVSNCSIHLGPETNILFAYLERRDDHRMDALPAQPVMRRWWDRRSRISTPSSRSPSGDAWLRRRDGSAGGAGHGLSRRAAFGDRRRLNEDRASLRRDVLQHVARRAVARSAALLARNRVFRGVRAGAVYHDLESVPHLPPRRSQDLRGHGFGSVLAAFIPRAKKLLHETEPPR